MATSGSQYLPFDPNPRKPSEAPPRNSCDCQFHISGEGYKTRPGATYHSPGATYQAARKMHEVLGIDRGVIVQSTVYATDHTIVLDALSALGPSYRAIGVMDDSVSDAEMAKLSKAGVRGVRFSFGKHLNMIPSAELFARSAARCKEIGWIVKINLPEDGLATMVPTIKALRDQPVVIDHLGRMRGLQDPNLPAMIEFLRQGNIWVMMSNGHRVSKRPQFSDAIAVGKKYIETNPERMIWGSDWPHPLHTDYMPNDAELLELFYRYTDNDQAMRQKILVDNPAKLFGFN
jgi:predicted TIM-barrel fold metal-dependent hydrolase